MSFPARFPRSARAAAWALYPLIALLAAAPAAAAPQEGPDDYALRIALPAPADASLLSVALPEAAYRAMREPGLADLRVFNAAGELLPVAVLPPPRRTETLRGEATLLPLPPGPAGAAPPFQGLAIQRDAAGRLTKLDLSDAGAAPDVRPRAWIADLLDFPHPLSAVSLRWGGQADFSASLRLEGSRDLVAWQTLAAAAPVIVVQQGGQRIEQVRIPVSASGTLRYLRLSWATAAEGVSPAALALESEQVQPQPPAEWLELAGESGDAAGEFRYVSPALLPVVAAEPDFAEANTVARLSLLARARNRDPWRFVAQGRVHRLRQADGSTEASPPLSFAVHREPLWLLRFDPRTAPREAPRLRLGWTPETLVFPARGAGPYTLAVGRAGAGRVLYPAAAVVPGYGTEQAAPITPVPLDTAAIPAPGPAERDAPAWKDPRSLVLWAVLVLAVAMLAAMARSLWRERDPES